MSVNRRTKISIPGVIWACSKINPLSGKEMYGFNIYGFMHRSMTQ